MTAPAPPKPLCDEIIKQIAFHIEHEKCNSCMKSSEEYQNNIGNIPQTPPCPKMFKHILDHLSKCSECKSSNKAWNDNAIPITPAMREVSGLLSKGQLPGAELLLGVSRQLLGSLKIPPEKALSFSSNMKTLASRLQHGGSITKEDLADIRKNLGVDVNLSKGQEELIFKTIKKIFNLKD